MVAVTVGARRGAGTLICGCGGTKRHRKSHRSPFNRRVKNLSVTGHLRSETKVRLLSSRRGPMLPGRPRRHSRSALEQGEKRQGPPPNRKKPPQRSSSAFPKPRYTFWILCSSQTARHAWLGWSTTRSHARVVARRLVVQFVVIIHSFARLHVEFEERLCAFTGIPKTARFKDV